MSHGGTKKAANRFATSPVITAFVETILDDASAAASRTTLGLGGAALLADPVPLANGGTGAATADGARSALALTGGTYTPVRSAEVNLDANVTVTDGKYQRNASVVTVSGRFTADPTTTLTVTSFELSLPVASNIAAVDEISGIAHCAATGESAEITGSIANNTAVFTWTCASVASQTFSYLFQYEIL